MFQGCKKKNNKNKKKMKRPYGIKSIRVDVNLKKEKIDGYNKIIHACHIKKKVHTYRGIWGSTKFKAQLTFGPWGRTVPGAIKLGEAHFDSSLFRNIL